MPPIIQLMSNKISPLMPQTLAMG